MGDLDIAHGRERGQQVELLEDEADAVLAQPRALGVRERGKVHPVDHHAAFGGLCAITASTAVNADAASLLRFAEVAGHARMKRQEIIYPKNHYVSINQEALVINSSFISSYRRRPVSRHISGRRREPETQMIKQPAVYILASERNGTLYIGVTSDLVKRIWEHKNNLVKGFTKRYNVHILVWYELHNNMNAAIEREKNVKEWKRAWKIRLLEENNPDWNDLYNTII